MNLKILLAVSLVVNVELTAAVTFLLKQSSTTPDSTPAIVYQVRHTSTYPAMGEPSTGTTPTRNP